MVANAGRVDIKAVAAVALSQSETLLREWLPDGNRSGAEFKAINPARVDRKPGSFSINVLTGRWSEFATGDAGGDLVSLYCYIFNSKNQIEAARDLGERLGVPLASADYVAPPAAPVRARSDWVPIVPVPADAPPIMVAHYKRGKPDARWIYRDLDGAILGAIWRFNLPDGGKDIVPVVYARNGVSGRCEWRNMQWAEPRPMYGLERLDKSGVRPVLMVEGEKCADAAHEVVGGLYDCVSWPGGGKAVKKVDWTPLAGRRVVVWPDADEPGMAAAVTLAQCIGAVGGAVTLIAGDVLVGKSQGWDVVDALWVDDWTGDDVRLVVDAALNGLGSQAVPKIGKALLPSDSVTGVDSNVWRARLHRKKASDPFSPLLDCRENVVLFLTHHEGWAGVFALDTFAEKLIIRRAAPIGLAAGDEWGEAFEVRMAGWFSALDDGFLIKNLKTIHEAVHHVGNENGFHPVRDYFNGLKWDGRPRISEFFSTFYSAENTEYHRLAARHFFINIIRRIFEPGCVMRTCLVLEGGQNIGKSRSLRALASDAWFSDTPIQFGSKDSYLSFIGRLIMELSELEGMRKAVSTLIKAQLSSQVDSFRPPYGRTNITRPRQFCFVATTNASEYLKDWSGNTRFVPVKCGATIDIAGISAARNQLFAEAIAAYRAGEQAYPTAEQQAMYFSEQQDDRMVSDSHFDAVAEWLHKNTFATVTVRQIMAECFDHNMLEQSKSSSKQLATSLGAYLSKLGWLRKRHSTGTRLWFWERPKTNNSEIKPVVSTHDDAF